ncbi:hypothetical protein WMY93_029205 [Mugilogobius chulae]|uniref:Uncharacterized protein n=1 Tax=Mugilogobius chulae TaxID=88201 RepID=A0AAW0N2C3_9GOBI
MVGGLTGGVVVGSGVSLQDKSELCVVRFEKELAGVGTTGCDVTVSLDSKASQRLSSSSPTCMSMSNAVSGMSSGGGSPQDTAPLKMEGGVVETPLTRHCTACASGHVCGVQKVCSTIACRTLRESFGSRVHVMTH